MIIAVHTTTPPRNSTSTRNKGPSGMKFCMWPYQTKLTTTQHNFNLTIFWVGVGVMYTPLWVNFSFWQKNYRTQIFLIKNFFDPQFFLIHKLFFDPKIFLTQKSFWSKIFWPKTSFWPKNIFEPTNFWSKIFLTQNKFSYPNFFWQNSFLTKYYFYN